MVVLHVQLTAQGMRLRRDVVKAARGGIKLPLDGVKTVL